MKSPFRNRGLNVVVDTTQAAEYDFALHNMTEAKLFEIETSLRQTPNSRFDRYVGDIRIREVPKGYETAFVLTFEEAQIAAIVIGLEPVGQLESSLRYLARAGTEQFAPGVSELLRGRKRK